jgi:hypothetical protein
LIEVLFRTPIMESSGYRGGFFSIARPRGLSLAVSASAGLYSAFHACTARVGVTHAGPRLPHWQQITKNNSRSVGTRESCSSRASQHGQGRGSGAPMMQACGAFGMEAFLHLVLLRRSLRPEQRAIWITPRKILCEVSHTPTEKSCRRFSKPDSTSCAPCSRMQGDASRISAIMTNVLE